jgi:hypothetical protein
MNLTLELKPALLASKEPLLLKETGFAGMETYSQVKEKSVVSTNHSAEEPMKRNNTLMNNMELPVNNFLKTLKEIEAEFYYVIHSIKNAFTEWPDGFDPFGRVNSDEAERLISHQGLSLPGCMEENY